MNHHQQRGAVLVVAMLLLLVMTVLGISGVENSLLEERMSGNFHESYTAMQSAETALHVAENWLKTNVTAATDPFENGWFSLDSDKIGLYSYSSEDVRCLEGEGAPVPPAFIPTNTDHWCSGSCDKLPKGYMELGGRLPAIDGVSQQPRFIIEYLGRGMGAPPSLDLGCGGIDTRMRSFRITAIGWGREAVTRYVLQSHYQLQL